MTRTYEADERTLEKVIRSILDYHAPLNGYNAEEVHGVVHGKSRENFISNVAERLREEVKEVREVLS